MKLLTIVPFVIMSLTMNPVMAKTPVLVPKVIYGEDDRLDVFESSDNLMKELSRSTAAQVLNHNLTESNGVYIAKSGTLMSMGVCKNERFANQMTAANCSGFLVAPDKLVTAGHCVTSDMDCNGHYWVFDFANAESEKKAFGFNKNQVFRCSKIIERKQDETGADYAVLKLERAVTGRTPLRVRTSGQLSSDAELTVIGNPVGLPTKITSSAKIRNNSNPIYFSTNADTYHGNSGSAVIDSRTGIVEGILVRGDTDFTRSSEGCLVSAVLPQDSGRGEDVTRITVINDLK